MREITNYKIEQDNKEIEHNVLTIKKYVIANFDEKTKYLRTMDGENGAIYLLTDNIEYASKTHSKTIAKYLLQMYRERTQDYQDFVVLPLRIKYDLLEEIQEENKITQQELTDTMMNVTL